MTSSTISVNFNDMADKTVFTATEKCILKLSTSSGTSGRQATFKLNSTKIGEYSGDNNGSFRNINRSLANVLSFSVMTGNGSEYSPTALILYLEEGDTVYAALAMGSAFTLSLNSAVFTF